jgi:glycine/D-amino acid oxidase-like deaminating enzyme
VPDNIMKSLKQPIERITPDQVLPAKADVVIIGAGIAGCSAAWELTKKGLKVVLLEKGIVGCEQSSRNWGWCRQQGRAPDELELAKLSLQMWPTLGQELGQDPGFRTTGVTFLTDKEEEIEGWREWQKHAALVGIHSEILGSEQANRIVQGGSGKKWLGALTTPSDGRAEPSRVAPYMAKAAQAKGASVLENCAVHALDRSNGKVCGVQTERGYIACQSVIVAAGAWTSLFLRKCGVDFPQAYVYGSVTYTEPVTTQVQNCISTPYFSFRARQDGGYTVAKSGRGTVYLTPTLLRYALKFWPTYQIRRKNVKLRLTGRFWTELKQEFDYLYRGISPFEQNRVIDPDPDMDLVGDAIKQVGNAFPALSDLKIAGAWGGCIDSTPDAVPVLSRIDAVPGLVVAAGFSGHGFGLGPGVGRLLSSLVTGDAAPVDIKPFRHSRMIDGTRLVPYIHF